MANLDLVKVFSATRSRERSDLGDRVTEWLKANPKVDVKSYAVRQSSDREFHCISITLFCTGDCTRQETRD